MSVRALRDRLRQISREKFFIGLLAFFVVAAFLYPVLRAQNIPQISDYRSHSNVPYGNLRDASLDRVIAAYHNEMNEEMNRRIGFFMDATPEELRAREMIPVRNEQGILPDCPEKFTSTFCVARKLLDEYAAFREELLSRKRNALEEARREGTQENLQALAAKGDEISAKIDRELAVSEKTIDMALAAYDELHLALPLHKKYQAVIDALSEYRDNLANMRDQVEKFPATFHNVSTTQCT